MAAKEQSFWVNQAAGMTLSYIRLVGIFLPSEPFGLTQARCSLSVSVYRVFTMAQASRAPSRQADFL
jgi:hypothetical protein